MKVRTIFSHTPDLDMIARSPLVHHALLSWTIPLDISNLICDTYNFITFVIVPHPPRPTSFAFDIGVLEYAIYLLLVLSYLVTNDVILYGSYSFDMLDKKKYIHF